MVRDAVHDEAQDRREQTVTDHEATSLLGVQQRLLARFPGLGPAVVHRVVQAAYVSMTGPIRDFVPLLVEHSARDTLTDLTLREHEHGRGHLKPAVA